MPNYTVQDTQTGKTITFEWNDKNPPTDADMEQIFASAKDFNQKTTTQPIDPLKDIEPLPEANVQGVPEEFGRPIMEMGAMGAGSSIGMASPIPGGSVIGGGLGYGIGKKMADVIYSKPSGTVTEELKGSAKDVAEGMFWEMLGQSSAEAIKYGAKVIGEHFAKPFLGRLSGVGKAAIDEALRSAAETNPGINFMKSKSMFDKALRGKISGEEIVDIAKSALNEMKMNRGVIYQKQLAEIASKNPPLDLYPMGREFKDLLERYNIGYSNGKFDLSRIGMGVRGRKDIEKVLETILDWGKKEGDNTVLGLDILKRQLDDFYSESSQARGFVTEAKNIVKDYIIEKFPPYAEMTKGYAEATNLIKDIEKGLMLRKHAMTGRLVADQTLRRLISTMRDNFTLRKEMLDTLSSKSSKDVAALVAGHAMRSPMPMGLAGTGPVLIAETIYARFFDPRVWPLLAASSPRVQAEFLRLWGQSIKMFGNVPPSSIGATMLQVEKNEETIE